MKFKIAERTDKGIREINQDSHIVFANADQDLFLAVADGMGGHIGGQVASQFAVKALKEYFKNLSLGSMSEEEVRTELVRSIKFIIKEFKKMGEEQPKFKDMGTTLNFNVFVGNTLWTVNVGDSRATRVDYGGISQISEDHNLAALAKRDKRFERFANDANLLTSSLGPSKETSVDVFKTVITQPGNLIITSDGVHQFVSEDFMVSTFLDYGLSLGEKADRIIDEAVKNKTHDNYTIVAVQYDL